MVNFETFKDNLDIQDKYNIKDLIIDKTVNYRGCIDLMQKCDLNYSKANNIKVPPLAAAVVGLNNTDAPLPTKTRFFDAWTDIDAQELYLSSKPTCYLIIGKPGTGAHTLGEAISKKLNCIHLCPRNVILDEIEQNSPTGRCIDFNMKHNKVCKFDTIFPIIKEKVMSPAVQHRGYVLSGLPLVTTKSSDQYLTTGLNGEESILQIEDLLNDVLVNLKKKKKKRDDDTTASFNGNGEDEGNSEEEAEEEQETENENIEEGEEHVELPKFLLEQCSNMISCKKSYMSSRKIVLVEQVTQILNLPLKPDVIIYITCPEADVVYKKKHTFLNYGNSSTIYESPSSQIPSDLRLPPKCDMNVDCAGRQVSHTYYHKYNCRQPMNFRENSVRQICNFRNDISSFIDWQLEQFEPLKIIKLDGHITINEMMHHIFERLLLLPIKPVHIPEPMYLEDPSDDMEEFWQTIGDSIIIQCNNVTFNRYASPWFNRCPVELKKRRSKSGHPKYAVSFMKHVYLMATLSSMIQFCRNPRPFLKLEFLEPTCRAIIIGTMSTGKTMNSKCLSWIFDATYIDYNTLYEQEKQKKTRSTEENVFSEIIATVEDSRLAAWQASELERETNLNAWYNTTLKNLQKYLPLLNKYLSEAKCYCSEKGDVVEPEQPLDPEFLRKFQNVRNELLMLPFINDVEEIQLAITDKNTLLSNAPYNLMVPATKPALPVIGDVDVDKAIKAYIVVNELQKNLEPTPDELMTELFKILADIDKKAANTSNDKVQYGKWVIDGFPSDPEFWELLSSSNFMPDYIVALIENREIEPEILEEYKVIQNSYKNYEERFLLAKDPLIKTALLKKKPSYSKLLDVQIIVITHVDSVLDAIFNIGQDGTAEAPDSSAEVAAFTEAIDKFREDWESIQSKIEEANKCAIIIERDIKTDVEILEEMLLKIRQGYYFPCIPGEPEEPENLDEDEDNPKDPVTFNLPYTLCDTGVYCPVAYYDYGVLWEGKPEYSMKYNNKMHLFSNENNLNEKFAKDVTKYQAYNKPYKDIPSLKICVMGCIGSGKTTISKYIAKELGLIHIDLVEFINEYLIPRHFKKTGRQYENSFTDSPIEEEDDIQINEENLEADLLSNETEFRRVLISYFEQGLPFLPLLMQKLLKKLWFQEPFSSTGFVLDGFPRMQTDVEAMIACYCIPDVIIDLNCSSDIALERLAPIMFKTWKTQMTEAKNLVETKFAKEKSKWLSFVAQQVVCKLILEEIINGATGDVDPTSILLKAPSTESYNMETDAQDPDLLTMYYNEIVETFPEPVDLSIWEKPADARERIEARIESVYEIDEGNIENTKDYANEQRIKIVSIDNTRPLNKTLRKVSAKFSTMKNRSQSFFEQTFLLDADVAERLLLEGFYFYSKFIRMCPVHIFENPNSIMNPYKVMKSKGMIYTVAHRSYIYFISGKSNLEKFRFDPLKYVASNNITNFHQYPVRFSIIGPPKSGKSTLASKLAKKLGLICISKGKAIRHVLEKMHWTELGNKIMKLLKDGKCVETDLVIKAIQTVATDHHSVTSGCVFDGFPDNPSEAMGLLNIGLYPLIIFDISSEKSTILKNSRREIWLDIVKYRPPYSEPFVENRFTSWFRKCSNIRDWVQEDIQNLCVLNGNQSQWQCLQDATIKIDSTKPEVYHYLHKVNSEIVPAGVMCISNAAFERKMSNYRDLCPVCLLQNVLRHSHYPVDKKGVLEYKYKYYWVCAEHKDLVLKYPEHYLSAKRVELPEIPAIVKTVNLSYVYENGICIVCYAENLPAQKTERGNSKFAASYQRNTYLFCSVKCLKKFLAKPQLYYNVVVFKDAKLFPEIALKKLPHIGYLEQTLGNMITEACCSLNVLRPKYPGLDIKLSGLIYIALYLKTHNERTDKEVLAKCVKSLNTYEARCKLMINVGLRMRAIDNPFAKYPVCHHPLKKRQSVTTYERLELVSQSHISEGRGDASSPSFRYATSRVPVPDERYDFLCEYHKPASKVPAFLNVVDIAGLVKGAAEGQGLGNAFLSHIKACDAIFNLCRAFDDEDVIHVDGEVNPVRDLETIGEELRLKDEEQLMASLEKLERTVNRGGDKKLKPEYDALVRIKAVLVDEKKHIRFGDWSAADIEVLNRYLFITSKPALYLVNLSEKDYIRKKNKWLPKLKEWIDKNDPGAPLIPFSGVLETKLMDMEPAEKQAFLKEHGITSALDKIIVAGYKALQLEYFFTAGADEVKAWIIQKGTKAPQAAGRIHTDFEKGFIMAEVMHFKDFKEEGSEAACKSAGKYRQQGRNYTVEDGDIIFFKFNAGAGLKDAKKK